MGVQTSVLCVPHLTVHCCLPCTTEAQLVRGKGRGGRGGKADRVGGQGEVEIGKEQRGREGRGGQGEGKGVDRGTPSPFLLLPPFPFSPQLVKGKGREWEKRLGRQRGKRGSPWNVCKKLEARLH